MSKKFELLPGFEELLLPSLQEGHIHLGGRDGYSVWGAATLETDDISLSLNLHEACQVDEYPKDSHAVVARYFLSLCEENWARDGYLCYPVSVNWNASDWKDQLEADMEEKLSLAIETEHICLQEKETEDTLER